MNYVSKFKVTFIVTIIVCTIVAVATGVFALEITDGIWPAVKWSILGVLTIGAIISALLTKGSEMVNPIFELIGAALVNGIKAIFAGAFSMDGVFFIIAFVINFIKAIVYAAYAVFLLLVLIVSFWNSFIYYSIMSILEMCHVINRSYYKLDAAVQKSGKAGAILLMIIMFLVLPLILS